MTYEEYSQQLAALPEKRRELFLVLYTTFSTDRRTCFKLVDALVDMVKEEIREDAFDRRSGEY